MIVDSPPYDLVVVFADADMQRFAEQVIERAQERCCLAPFRWRSIRDPHRDSLVAGPERACDVFRSRSSQPRLILLWDHVGSGREGATPGSVEAQVVNKLMLSGWPRGCIAAIAVLPEFEGMLEPVWAGVKSALAVKRQASVPTDSEVLERSRKILQRRSNVPSLPDEFGKALAVRPKEVLDGLVSLLNLRVSPALFAYLGGRLSIPGLKGLGQHEQVLQGAPATSALQRLASILEQWFPGAQGGCHTS